MQNRISSTQKKSHDEMRNEDMKELSEKKIIIKIPSYKGRDAHLRCDLIFNSSTQSETQRGDSIETLIMAWWHGVCRHLVF